jgi:protein-tyrosine phosphatase
MNEIIDKLFVGDVSDAQAGFDGLIICVLEEKPIDEPPNALWIPFEIGTLDIIASAVDNALASGRRVLVHCGAGSERAPLTVAWFLNRRREMSLEAAYDLLKLKRPNVRDRRNWLRRNLDH